MRRVGERLRAAHVAAIYLAHGTFVGGDSLGLLLWLRRWLPALAESAEQRVKSLVDDLMDDLGNWSPDYARRLEQAINVEGQPHIAVRRFVWSGENHHLGRADGAVRLLHELLRAAVSQGSGSRCGATATPATCSPC